jgi:fructose-1,6-bisphosphatase-3
LAGFFTEGVPLKFKDTLIDLNTDGLTDAQILDDLITLLRGVTRGDERRIIKTIPPIYLENILKLYSEAEHDSATALVSGIIENKDIFHIISSIIVKLILSNMVDKHINIGDTYDRGEDADKLVNLYRNFFDGSEKSALLHYIWGNHDILWMGAAIGNPILVMTALRISMRYNNVAFLDRYGFNMDKLRAYAKKQYKLVPHGNYTKKMDDDDAIKMTKVLSVLENKLVVSCLREAVQVPGEIDYNDMLSHYESLLNLLPTGVEESQEAWDKMSKEKPLFLDSYFPTVDENNREELTAEEKEISDNLIHQFMTLPKLQEDIKWMFEKGETYRVVDNTLYFHAALPATKELGFAEFKGLQGKQLLDFVQRDMKRIGGKHATGKEVTLRESMLLWYLWCGEKSVFFCKSKMATMERTIFDKVEASRDPLTTWKEHPNPFYKNLRNDVFLKNVLNEFHAEKLCVGHTPVKNNDQAVLSDKLGAFVIDGGASPAYGDRGAVLINTAEFTYVTMHPNLEELKKAEQEDRLPNFDTSPIEEKSDLKLRHMDKGFYLKEELQAINELMERKLPDFNKSYFE